MLRSRHSCPETGVYQSDCACQRQVAMQAGEGMPSCTACRHPVGWELLYRMPWLERPEPAPAPELRAPRRPA